jgi:hypothetical protein
VCEISENVSTARGRVCDVAIKVHDTEVFPQTSSRNQGHLTKTSNCACEEDAVRYFNHIEIKSRKTAAETCV